MKFLSNKKILVTITLLAVLLVGCLVFTPGKKVDFSADVKPIINKKCITCHGGVRAKGGFSLLFREEALAKTKSGKPAIIPGDPEGSEMIRRIINKDPEERMPFKHAPLSEDEIATLKAWIKEGAPWGNHWAYLPVKPVEVPDENSKWGTNDIDRFIYAKLEKEKLHPSAEADKPTLLRRLSLDLTGMYPSALVATQYLQSKDPKAYEMLVDSLLASPHFGERWASLWLDLSRYADTKGYEADGGRNVWKYRDWLIDAFNSDKPYDKFLIEQVAGDLLKNPTDAQYIATAFSRNTMTNDEGGTNNEEFRTAAVLDRVNTTWESLMGTTFACVQCHSHPYDPFHHDEYYKFVAYFNNTRDEDIPGEYPVLREFNDSMKQNLSTVTNWIGKNSSVEETQLASLFLRTGQPAIYATTTDSLKNAVTDNANLMFRNHAVARIKDVHLENADIMVWNLYSTKNGSVLKMHLDRPDGPVLATLNIKGQNSWRKEIIEFNSPSGVHDIYLTYDNPVLPKGSEEILVYCDYFSFIKRFPGQGLPGYEDTKKMFWDLVNANVPTIPVMVENPLWMQRKTHVFERGNRMLPGAEVTPDVPNSLRFAMPANAPKNRMGLAMWLTDKRNPLVSRTAVNRLWEQLFGTGIVETLEDMGTQGMLPTHQELLDHLSWQLMNDYQWSLKKLLREMVMSATYRQESKMTKELEEKDAGNRYYARGPRVRLSAEQLRDQHLCISGEMSPKMYGPGVMPWQPLGIWLSPYNSAKWENSKGEDRYRRAVYTYWKRTAPYPSMISFDGVQRVLCTARRTRTNTPLQALVTLNDSVYLDMAGHFAERMRKEAGDDIRQQVAKGYEMMLFKPLPPEKQKVFVDLYNIALNEFKTGASKMRRQSDSTSSYQPAPQAALVVVANAMLNIDEVVMKN